MGASVKVNNLIFFCFIYRPLWGQCVFTESPYHRITNPFEIMIIIFNHFLLTEFYIFTAQSITNHLKE